MYKNTECLIRICQIIKIGVCCWAFREIEGLGGVADGGKLEARGKSVENRNPSYN